MSDNMTYVKTKKIIRKNKLKKKSTFFAIFLFLIILISFNISCIKRKEKNVELVPDYNNINGIFLEVIPASFKVKPNTFIPIKMKLINYMLNTSDVNITFIVPDYVKFYNEKNKEISSLKYSIRGMSEIRPGGGTFEDIIYLLSTKKEDQIFSVVFNYCFQKSVEEKIIFCLDYYSAGYSPLKGCEYNVKLPLYKGNPLYIKEINYDLKKIEETEQNTKFSISFTIFFDYNKRFYFYKDSCDKRNFVNYGKILVNLTYPYANQEKKKSKILELTKDNQVTFEFIISRSNDNIKNVEEYIILSYNYVAESNLAINDFYVDLD
ncbi:MAG: hypothetical protein QXR30_00425 [Candidatus Woesearchaeota archaeon]